MKLSGKVLRQKIEELFVLYPSGKWREGVLALLDEQEKELREIAETPSKGLSKIAHAYLEGTKHLAKEFLG